MQRRRLMTLGAFGALAPSSFLSGIAYAQSAQGLTAGEILIGTIQDLSGRSCPSASR